MGNPQPKQAVLRFIAVLAIGLFIGVFMGTEGQPLAKKREVEKLASDSTDTSTEALLRQVLDNQKQILERFDEVMSELQIVKMRATVRR